MLLLFSAASISLVGSSGCSGDERTPTTAAPGSAPVPPAMAAERARPPAPRVILLLSIDTLRADHLGLYGHHRFTSPVLDSVAAEGVVFEDASSTAPWTLPAHASMLTGRFPLGHGVMTMKGRLPDDVPTLASLLSARGWQTAAVVNNTWLRKETYELTRDFEHYLLVDFPDDRRSPNTWVTDQAIEWLRELGQHKLLLFIHYFDVHSDYASLPEFEKLFVTPYSGEANGSAWQLQTANFEDDYIELCRLRFDPEKCRFGGPDGPRLIDGSTVRFRFDADDIRRNEELYDAGIRQLDTELGRLFGFLYSEGLQDETLLLITSDHGEEFMDHGRVDHFLTQYQEVLRVPLIVRGPGVAAGLRIDAPVSLVDIVPTLLGITGVPAPALLEGLDFSTLLVGEADDAALRPFRERLLFGEASGGLTYASIVEPGIFPIHRSLRRGRHKLIHDSKSDRYALYDLVADPREQIDVAAREPEIVAELKRVMRDRYRDFTLEPRPENQVQLGQDDIERLRALGYVP